VIFYSTHLVRTHIVDLVSNMAQVLARLRASKFTSSTFGNETLRLSSSNTSTHQNVRCYDSSPCRSGSCTRMYQGLNMAICAAAPEVMHRQNATTEVLNRIVVKSGGCATL
jgi:hypothetical protein